MTPNESYHERMRDSKNREAIRRAMVEFVFAHGETASLTAGVLRTSRRTVITWVKPYRGHGCDGLRDVPPGPHHSPARLPNSHQQLIAKARTNDGRRPKTRIGQDKIKLLLQQRHGIKMSTSTINRVLRELDLIQPRKKEYQKKREIARYREKLQPLAHWQVDVNYLDDITHIYPK